ncbi:hypothetical protein SH661x_003888 [Planctomicrobium sp. SH661]
MIYLGNITITSLAWSESGGFVVRFESDHGRLHQLYIGRRLYGETRGTEAREIVAQYDTGGSQYPEHVCVVAVDDADVGLEHGSKLPPRPYNRVRVRFPAQVPTGDAIIDDVRTWELFTGQAPEGAVNYDTARDVAVVDGLHPYELESQPLGPSGEWNVGVLGRDTTELDGNVGTPVEQSAHLLSYPPDFDDDFSVAVSAGIATINCMIPQD